MDLKPQRGRYKRATSAHEGGVREQCGVRRLKDKPPRCGEVKSSRYSQWHCPAQQVLDLNQWEDAQPRAS